MFVWNIWAPYKKYIQIKNIPRLRKIYVKSLKEYVTKYPNSLEPVEINQQTKTQLITGNREILEDYGNRKGGKKAKLEK